MKLLDKVEKYCIENNLIKTGDRIVVGVSGGPDSLCLLTLLSAMSDKYNLTLTVVHINHMLRKEADYEEQFVKEFSEKLGIKFFSKKADIISLSKKEKRSTEEVARQIRYDFFEEVRKKVNAEKIAVAHNKNDNAETILLNIIRGCGTDGLIGIEKENKNIIRPLIDISRKEIEEYCEELNLSPMIDKTNFETIYTRNKIRNLIIPQIEEINPDIIEGLSRFSKIIKEDEEFIDEYVNSVYAKVVMSKKEEFYIDREEFLILSLGLKRRILRKAILDFSGSLKDISFATIDNAIRTIMISKTGNLIKIAKNIKILVEYDKLKFMKKTEEIKDYEYELNVPGKTYIKEINKWIVTEIKNADEVPDTMKNQNIHFFDIEKTGKKLYVRNRKKGDYFFPTGMNGKKKIKNFFSDLKIPSSNRNQIPIITNGEEIIWVVGFRSSKKFLKDNISKEVIIINYGENI